MKAILEDIKSNKGTSSFHAFRYQVPYFQFKWHYHPEYELTYIVKGKGYRIVGDSYEYFTDGDLVLLGSNLPHTWSENLTIEEKCRYTINALMRMRFCKEDGELEFEHKLNVDKNPTGYKAWFLHKNRLMKEQKIFFGHWSSLKNVNTKNIYPLDHGCIWGGQLTAYNLTNNTYISQDSVEI